jgi:23S rRNA (pseudouridine1915-N3)-methyltransferase
MKIRLIAVGNRMPGWVTEGYGEYARRMPRECALSLIEIPLGQRARTASPLAAIQQEGRRMLAALNPAQNVVALDVDGRSWSTQQLAERLQGWLQDGRDLALLVGGPDGLAADCLQRAEMRWSLSPLTLPHALVRVVVAEQLYRAWTVLSGHPYHRA